VTVNVLDTIGSPEAGLRVYAFDGTTNADGQIMFNLPEGNYRFRADKNGRQYFSAAENHCTVVGCTNAAITVPVFGAVSLTVNSSGGFAQPDLPVYAFNGSTYSGVTIPIFGDGYGSGQVGFTLP
jgi:hypothetical protein